MVSHNQAIVDILSCCFAISHDSNHLATREAEVPRYWISTLDSRKLQGMASSTSRSSHWLMNMMKPEQVDIWKYTRIRIETMLQREYYFLKKWIQETSVANYLVLLHGVSLQQGLFLIIRQHHVLGYQLMFRYVHQKLPLLQKRAKKKHERGEHHQCDTSPAFMIRISGLFKLVYAVGSIILPTAEHSERTSSHNIVRY